MPRSTRQRSALPCLLLAGTFAVPSLTATAGVGEPWPPAPAPTTSSTSGSSGSSGSTTTTPSTTAPAPKTPVDLELSLLVDVSASVDDTEFALQMQGYAEAFRDPHVQAAVTSMEGVAIRMALWSSTTQKRAMSWRVLESPADCEAFADAVAALPRPFEHNTVMSQAIRTEIISLVNNDYESPRQVIDVSGDGVCDNYTYYQNGAAYNPDYRNPWASVMATRPYTMAINGISVGDEPGLADWYAQTLAQGPGSFALHAADFTVFAEGIKQKLLREINADFIGYD